MTEPIGYYVGHNAYCLDCAARPLYEFPMDAEWHPIFPTDEADSPTHCHRCEALIRHALTSDGYDYVADAIGEHLRNPENVGRACIVAEWWHSYRDGFDRNGLAVRILDQWADAQPSHDRYSPNAKRQTREDQ